MAGRTDGAADTDVTVRAIARGRVQGVGFRWFVREAAKRSSLAGWVRNNADGSVELVVRGPSSTVEDFLETVRGGPSGARVDSLDIAHNAAESSPARPFAIL
jgi:acylphosphatase